MPRLSRTLRPSYLTSCFLSPSQFFHSLFPCSRCILLHHIFTNHHLAIFFYFSLALSLLSTSGCCHASVIEVYLKAVQSIKSPGFQLSLCHHLRHAPPSLHHTAYSLSPFIIKGVWGKLWLCIALASHLLNHHSVSVDCSVGSDTSLLLVTYSVPTVSSPGCHSTVMCDIWRFRENSCVCVEPNADGIQNSIKNTAA